LESFVVQRWSVLILEDEYLLATALADLVAAAGYSVVGPAASAARAQALMNEDGIDAALLDIRLGDDERSFELAARLQALRIPFAFVTAYSPSLFPLAFTQVPCLVKPPTGEGVAALLHRLLPRPAAG
jgi:DNA-binding response OmpR family regulator